MNDQSHEVVDLSHSPGKYRLHIVTGKGGTGKTSVAAALALSLAEQGQKVLLAEAEQRQALAKLFGRVTLSTSEELLRREPGGGEIYGLAIDPEAALLDYLELFYNLRSAGAILRRIGAVSFATTVAPGLRDVLMTGKTCEAVRRRSPTDDSQWAYDAVVLDAPPTGRIVPFLNVTSEVVGIAKVGPIKAQADWVSDVLHSHQTGIWVVTTTEEMPMQEAKEALTELVQSGFNVTRMVVNMLVPDPLTQEQVAELESANAVTTVTQQIKQMTGEANQTLARAIVEFGRDDQVKTQDETAKLQLLAGLGVPLLEIPRLGNSIDATNLSELSRFLMPDLVKHSAHE